MKPYFDRARQREVYTTFDATVEGSVMRGRLLERVHLQWRELGTWTAEHVAERPE